MKKRGRVGAACFTIIMLALPGQSAWSQQLKIIVPYTPGSGPDILSRLMAEQIGRAQGSTVVVENRPGGGTMIGTEAAARAAPDGNTVLLVANSFVVNPALKKQNYDPTTSFDPICQLAATPLVLVVKGNRPTARSLISSTRRAPSRASCRWRAAARRPPFTSRSRWSSARPMSP